MVNTKKTKREKDIKSRLMAAIAMLLVSSIMMVSTTYAWFTLSTAPEVSGISTTIGANGNLEIALSPANGQVTSVGNAEPGSSNTKVQTNLTWGNLVDMNDEHYNLANLKLFPAKLVFTEANGVTNLSETPLAIPKYGNDGRISTLSAEAKIGGSTLGSQQAVGYKAGQGDYGVRAVGTSSNLSLQAAALQTRTSEISTYANRASKAAGDSLKGTYGNALASIMVAHVRAGDSDTTDYTDYVDELTYMVGQMELSVKYIDESIRSALVGMATSLEETAYQAAVSLITGKTGDAYTHTIDSILATMSADASGDMATLLANLQGENGIVTKYNKVASDVAAARAALASVPASNVTWNDISPILTKMMNVNADTTIKVGGFALKDLKEHKSDLMWLYTNLVNVSPLRIELGAGSGVYYNIAEIAGNMSATTSVKLDVSGMASFPENTMVEKDPVEIKTTYEGQTKLAALKVVVSNVNPAGGSGSAVMDAFYGYVVDLMLRTNAADSYLYLQTEAAQRVYTDSANEATMGKGTNIVFTTTDSADSVVLEGLCASIQVVFFDPINSNKVLGVAKVTDTTSTSTTIDGVTTFTVTGTLNLCNFAIDPSNGQVTVGAVKTDDDDQSNGKESQILCTMVQNTVQAVSAMVCLDGTNVTSADMLAEGTANGVLNLQFASSAELIPMNNSELKNGTTNP